MTSPISRVRVSALFALAAALVTLLAAVWPVSPASAHDQLVASDPAADAVVDALPAAITLTFSAELLGDGGSNVVEVTDAEGNTLGDGAAVVDGITLTQALTGEASGPLTVLWRVVSSDGHPISGEFLFSVAGETASTTAPSDDGSSPTPEPSMTTMTEPAESASPTLAPEPEASASNPLPWIIGVIVLLAVVGVVLYLLVIRPRRTGDGGTTGGDD